MKEEERKSEEDGARGGWGGGKQMRRGRERRRKREEGEEEARGGGKEERVREEEETIRPHWERNVILEVDSSEIPWVTTGPCPNKPPRLKIAKSKLLRFPSPAKFHPQLSEMYPKLRLASNRAKSPGTKSFLEKGAASWSCTHTGGHFVDFL